MRNENCTKSDLIVNVKTKRAPRFKAGSDLSNRVNHLDVDLNEELTDEHELVEVKLTLSSEWCSDLECPTSSEQ
ncbi:MAG: hypothetical protein ACO2Z9_09790 [Crocinitomicaceae bacterium]